MVALRGVKHVIAILAELGFGALFRSVAWGQLAADLAEEPLAVTREIRAGSSGLPGIARLQGLRVLLLLFAGVVLIAEFLVAIDKAVNLSLGYHAHDTAATINLNLAHVLAVHTKSIFRADGAVRFLDDNSVAFVGVENARVFDGPGAQPADCHQDAAFDGPA
jgi:hypothetical protein